MQFGMVIFRAYDVLVILKSFIGTFPSLRTSVNLSVYLALRMLTLHFEIMASQLLQTGKHEVTQDYNC